MNRLSQYFNELSLAIGSGWNRFWFTPADPRPLGVLRIGAGLVALYYHFSHVADLVRWFGPRGLLPIELVRQLIGADVQPVFRPSYLNLTNVPEVLWTLHALGFLILLAMTVGLFTRASTVLSLVVVLSYVHRAPMISGPLEPVLTMLIGYLCLAPAGRYYSLDRKFGLVKSVTATGAASSEAFWTANLALRLIQVHLAGFYLMMGLMKVAGPPWWDGSAAWLLIAQTDTRIVDLTGLSTYPYVLNLITHAIVLFELSMGTLIWNRMARPLLLLIALPMWLLVGVISGELGFAAVMLVANLAFVPAAVWQEMFERSSSKELQGD